MRFALLEHDKTAPTCPPQRDVHWDLIVEVPDVERLPTWRLARSPAETRSGISAERIADHRPVYLDYEGEISGGRGFVRRVDSGTISDVRVDGDRLSALFDGRLINGRHRIAPGRGGKLLFGPAPT